MVIFQLKRHEKTIELQRKVPCYNLQTKIVLQTIAEHVWKGEDQVLILRFSIIAHFQQS